MAGRGAVITNLPLTARTAFDRTRIEGDLPTGWEAELYRNGRSTDYPFAFLQLRLNEKGEKVPDR